MENEQNRSTRLEVTVYYRILRPVHHKFLIFYGPRGSSYAFIVFGFYEKTLEQYEIQMRQLGRERRYHRIIM